MSNNYHNSSDSLNPQSKKTVDESKVLRSATTERSETSSTLNFPQAEKTRIEPNPEETSRTPFVRKDPLEGQTIGDNNRYLLQTLVGEGGMSKVYQALDTKFEDRTVAIKLMTNYFATSGEHLIKRFMGEVKAISRLKHPNIIQILDFGITPNEPPFNGSPFYVMEYLAGQTLQQLLTKNKIIPIDSLLKIISQVCAGLQQAHQKGIVHRDLKPDNIFLVSGGAFGEIVKIIDFGIAKNISSDDKNHTKLTQEGSFIGTYRYASPEQCRGLGNIDLRTDIYSLGIILYEAICGKNPYDLDDDFTASQADWIACHIRVPPKPIKQQVGYENIGYKLEQIVMKCLAKSPEDRFSNIGELQNTIAKSFSVKTVVETISNNPPKNSDFIRENKVTPTPKNLSVSPESRTIESSNNLGVTRSRRKVLQYGGLMLGGVFLTLLVKKILEPKSTEEPLSPILERPKFEIDLVKNIKVASLEEIWSLAISPDGKWLASGNNQGIIKLFDLETGDLNTKLGTAKNVIRSLAFIPGSNKLISGDGDGNITIWNQNNNSLESELKGHLGSIWSLAVSPDGETLISSSEDKTIRIWNLATGDKNGIIFAKNTVVYGLAFSTDGKIFASAGQNKIIGVWDSNNRKILQSLEGHEDGVRSLAISPDNKYLVSGSWDKTVKVWQLESGKLINNFQGHQDRVVTVAISKDSGTIFSGGLDNTIKVWSIENAKLITTLSQHQNWVLALATSQLENLLVSAGKDSTVKLWQY